ncbi:uncharacterized protein [Channa argus]|uniref:uncharacterized protein n=1 Tax=Channa argus TaxID=215402 RepID=UPI0035213583
MASPKLVLYLACLFSCTMAQMTDLSSFLQQKSSFISTYVGETITLQCFYDSSVVARYYWYKQTLGQKPRLISSYYVYDKKCTFYDEFQNNPRFTLDTEIGKNHLIIGNVSFSDSAIYFCASSFSITFTFGEGTVVSVKGSGSNIPALVHQSVSGTLQAGGSVTLNCTVHTGTSDGEHSVYWFKDAEESLPSIIYTHGNSSNQCKSTNNSKIHICAYNLLMKSVNHSHTGTYHCAVALCGHILFGNGTQLNFWHKEHPSVLLHFLSGALAFTSIFIVLLALLLFITKKRSSCQSTESDAAFSAPSTTNAEGFQNLDNVHYGTIVVNKANRSRGHRQNKQSTMTECVYTTVKQYN